MNINAGSGKTLFDFQTLTNIAVWQVINDDVWAVFPPAAFAKPTA
jgi:hypothetical protein